MVEKARLELAQDTAVPIDGVGPGNMSLGLLNGGPSGRTTPHPRTRYVVGFGRLCRGFYRCFSPGVRKPPKGGEKDRARGIFYAG
jgi:hypothetical protein